MRTNGVLGQLIRFGIAGGISTVVYFAVYLPLADYVLPVGAALIPAPWGRMVVPWAVFAVPPGFLVAVAVGFFLHSTWSFKGYGTRDNSGRQHLKFLLVQLFGLLLNMAFTWIMTGPLHLPNWSTVFPIVTITPLATFTINRQLVFN
jgi:putative flippase GtrA